MLLWLGRNPFLSFVLPSLQEEAPRSVPPRPGRRAEVRREITKNKRSHRGLRLSHCLEDRHGDGATHCLTLPCHPPHSYLD